MLEGKTADCLAIANTAILMRLIEGLIARRVVSKAEASAFLREAIDSLRDCPNADHSNFVDAIAIIHKELMPRIADVRLR